MKPTSISSLEASLQFMPLKAPFVTARGRSYQAPAVVIEVTTVDGRVGLGAASPAQFVTGESYEDIQSTVFEISESFQGADTTDTDALFADLRDRYPKAHSARAGVEIAVMDIVAQRAGVPLWRHWGGRQRQIATDLTVPISTLEGARLAAAEAAADGIACLKIKIDGTQPEESLACIRTIHGAAPDARLLVDANQSFTLDGALAFLDAARSQDLPISLFEQPVSSSDIQGLVKVAAHSPYPVAADEAVITPQDCRDVLDAGGVQVINIKLMKSGVSGALEIIDICRTAKVELMLGCMLESHIGIGAAVHLACGTGAFRYVDLDSHLLLKSDIATGAFTVQRDAMTAGETPGLGATLIEKTSN